MTKKNDLARIDPEFKKIMGDVMFFRANNGLAKKNIRELSLREATFLTRTAPSFNKLIEELKFLPKRKR